MDRLRHGIASQRLDRRQVLIRATGVGLSASSIASLLAACGGSDDEEPTSETIAAPDVTATTAVPSPTSSPEAASGGSSPSATEAVDETAVATATTVADASPGRGLGDVLRILYWQAPTILNPHFSQGTKDWAAASLVLEPLIDIDAEGNVVPVLITEVPSLENGDVAADGMSVTYRLMPGLVWSDGAPFSADDVRFTWQFITDPAASSTTAAIYGSIEDVEVVDPTTVTLRFKQPTPGWYNLFSTAFGGQILPRHLLESVMGAGARDAEFNLMPIGTGPYRVSEFRPGDVVLYEINENFREPSKPYFQRVELKGGGDASAAARAALETGETDWAWNLQVEKSILESFAGSETGVLLSSPGTGIERIVINFTDPNTEIDGARSEPGTTHPFFSDLAVREAFALSTDRETIASELYGPSGTATANLLVGPARFVSPNTDFDFDVDAAGDKLDGAGWLLEDGKRMKDGTQMSVLFQTSVNPLRQKTQEICKQAWEQLGIATEIKAVDAGVYFSSDPGNPETYAHFYADLQMGTSSVTSPYPINFMALYKSDNPAVDLPQKANQWSGRNQNRWVNEEYNRLYQQALTELDPDRQVDVFIAMNDLIVNEVVDIALVHRTNVSGANARLKGYEQSPWTSDVHDIANWYMEE